MGRVVAAAVLCLIVASAVLAPVYARFVSGTDPFRSAPMAMVGGVPVLADNPGLGVTPIGPGWRGAYLLGADGLGRDVAARLLYGGRTSLSVAGAATLLCLVLGMTVGTVAGFWSTLWGGWLDGALSGLVDLLWAFPVYLLAISLSVVLVNEGLHVGPVVLEADSAALPVLILGVVYVPYVARPVRAAVLAIRGLPFVEAATATGGTQAHILRRHVLPQLVPTVASLLPILAATVLLTEAALSILGLGVQPPSASWGTLIADGQALLYTRPVVAIAPGVAVAATVLALNALVVGT